MPKYEMKLDPARPFWPGVVVVGPDDCLIYVQVGRPANFADSHRIAALIIDALKRTACPE